MAYKQKAFTLVEMMMTLVIGAILLALAVPSYRDFIQNNRAITMANSFVTALQLARSEAIRRGSFVAVCPALDTNFNACGGAGDWTRGWIVFADPDNNGAIASAEDIIQIHEAEDQNDAITPAAVRVTFANMGNAVTGSGNYILTILGCTGKHARTINVNTTGRVSTAPTACS